MEEIAELKIIINKMKIELLELTNRVLELEKTNTIVPSFGLPSLKCNNGHIVIPGTRRGNKTILCDVCQELIPFFRTFKTCRKCDYDICSDCCGDRDPLRNINPYPFTKFSYNDHAPPSLNRDTGGNDQPSMKCPSIYIL